jgi:nucleoside-diphosphate-sugar epimerase
MPTVEPSVNTKVLVSGVNGYIGSWVVRTLLEQGYTVNGAVRSVEKGERLRDHFYSYGDKVECVVVEDILTVRFDSLLIGTILMCETGRFI